MGSDGDPPPPQGQSLPGVHHSDEQVEAFENLTAFEFLEQDDRPTFTIDLRAPADSNPVYWNPILRRNKGLKDRILGLRSLYLMKQGLRHNADWTFLQWQRSPDSVGHANSCRYGQIFWVATTLRGRWRVISGVMTVQNIPSEPTNPLVASKPMTPENTSADDLLSMKSDTKHVAQPQNDENDDTANVTVNNRIKNASELLNGSKETNTPETPEEIALTLKSRLINVSPPPGLTTAEEDLLIEDLFLNRDGQTFKFAESLGIFDWTWPDAAIAVTPYIIFFRNFDWGSTKLGSIDSWSPTLRRYALSLLADPRPSAMFVGRHRVTMYNEGYRAIVGRKHPFLLGKPFEEGWAELGSAFVPSFRRAAEFGLGTKLEDSCFFIERANFLEEMYFQVAMIPLVLDDGEMVLHNPILESTRLVIAERRMTFLLNIGAETAGSREPKDFWSRLLGVLELNARDVPFALLYSARESMDDLRSNSEKIIKRTYWDLEGTVTYSKDFPIPNRLDPNNNSTEEFIPHFSDLIRAPEPTLLRRSDGSLPEHLVDNVLSRAFGDRCEAAMFIPIRSTGENALGFLLLGVDPRRPCDDDYQVFIQLLSRQLATGLASAVLFEDELRTSRVAAELAALDREELSQKLMLTNYEVKEAENRFRSLADAAPVGIFYFDAHGMPVYCNESWYVMTEHPRGAEYPMSWYNVIHPDDHALMDQEWANLSTGQPVSFEIRLIKPFKAAEIVGVERVEGPTWILAAAYATKREDGTVTAVTGCMTDISRQKWAEDFQTRRMKEAVELKRQQENFIDMTSHEMRNPLSAIVQCADSIGSSLGEFGGSVKGDVTIPQELVESNLDAAQTIALCAQHQKRIIDDVLTLSKLDSNLLLITPVEVQPSLFIGNALKMFDNELQKNNVELRFKVDDSYVTTGINWVKLDPSRVAQVLINLLSNAIKFTSTQVDQQKQRKITVSVGASSDRPTSTNGVKYLARNPKRNDMTDTPEWGTGDLVYLLVQVQDTGKGLHEHERKFLFQRFSQTSPRTHVQYGGSGLGLFISRELTELQGGEIGVQSDAGIGSTFAFFVKARRTKAPGSGSRSSDTSRQPSGQDFDIGKERVLDPAALTRLPHRTGSPSVMAAKKMEGKKSQLTISDVSKHVLVVEDNLVNQKVLSKQLKGAGCVVSVANHGGEALAFLEKSRFWVDGGTEELSVILMDLEMPVMDGLTCVKRIRELQRTGQICGHVPVIAVTANARSEQIATAKDSGMDGVVTKPFRIPELIPEMERLVRTAASIDK